MIHFLSHICFYHFCSVVGYRSNTAYGYDASKVVKGVRVLYHINSDITIDGELTCYLLMSVCVTPFRGQYLANHCRDSVKEIVSPTPLPHFSPQMKFLKALQGRRITKSSKVTKFSKYPRDYLLTSLDGSRLCLLILSFTLHCGPRSLRDKGLERNCHEIWRPCM